MDYFPQYRLHTPAEVSSRNKASRWEVVRDVVVQQAIQTAVGWGLGMTEPDDLIGKEEYDIAVWARRIRIAQRLLPTLLAFVGLDAKGLAKNFNQSHPLLAVFMLGGRSSTLSAASTDPNRFMNQGSDFTAWEKTLARAIYWVIVPAIQYGIAIVVVDAWQYFLHRAMHMNKWMYSEYPALEVVFIGMSD